MEESCNECLGSEWNTSDRSFSQTYKLHMNFVKGTSAVLLITPLFVLICSTIAVSVQILNTDISKCNNRAGNYTELNSTLCTYVKQFPLTEDVFATVCSYKRSMRLDIRYFINGRPTIKGIYINRRQFLYLKRSLYHIEYEMQKYGR